MPLPAPRAAGKPRFAGAERPRLSGAGRYSCGPTPAGCPCCWCLPRFPACCWWRARFSRNTLAVWSTRSKRAPRRYLRLADHRTSAAAELRLFDLGSLSPQGLRDFCDETVANGRLRLVRQGARNRTGGRLCWPGLAAWWGLGWMLHQRLSARRQVSAICCFAFRPSSSASPASFSAGRRGQDLPEPALRARIWRISEDRAGSPLRPAGEPGLPVKQAIRLERVSFTYPGGCHRALDEFNLEIPKEKVVALVGHNGAGKSTLIKLLCRFYDPDEGRILIRWRGSCGKWIRRRCAGKSPYFFRTRFTITQPCARISPTETSAGSDQRKRIREAAREAGAMEPIERLPDGFERCSASGLAARS